LSVAVPFMGVWVVEITLHPKVLPRLLRVIPPYDVTADGACVGPLEAIPHTRPLEWTQGFSSSFSYYKATISVRLQHGMKGSPKLN
jgi:hypothetical protein